MNKEIVSINILNKKNYENLLTSCTKSVAQHFNTFQGFGTEPDKACHPITHKSCSTYTKNNGGIFQTSETINK